jgi:hypothetical protein
MSTVLSHAVTLRFRGEKEMIIGSFIDKPGQFVSWLFQRQWAEWEIISLAAIFVFVFLWIIKQQRKRAFRNIYDNKFLESTPVIGTKLGIHKRRRHLIKDFKKSQLAAAQQGHAKQKESTKRTESEKLREQIKQLQFEIIKRKETEVRLEQQITGLMITKDELQHELAKLKQAEQPAELREEVEPTSEEKHHPVISESVQVGRGIGEESAEVSAKDKHVEKKPPKKGKTYEDVHRILDDVKQKLCRKCNEWKPESEFHKNASSKDGLAGSCKTCKSEAAKEYRKRRKTTRY